VNENELKAALDRMTFQLVAIIGAMVVIGFGSLALMITLH
jgi:hypothetical protein